MGKSSTRNFSEHNFYCINCGSKGISIMRNRGQQRSKFHRKKLYCPFCKETVNHIECKTPWEVEEFKINFNNGVYENEKEESLSIVRSSCLG